MRNDPTFGDLAVLRKKMVAWAKRFTHGASDAEDLVQAAFIRMHINRDLAPTAPDEIAPWAYTVLKHEFLNTRRLVKREFVQFDNELAVDASNPETQTHCRRVLGFCMAFDPEIVLQHLRPVQPSTTERVRTHRSRQRVTAALAT